MQYLSELNESLHNLRDSNSHLKRQVSESSKELNKLEQINLSQAQKIKHLDGLLSAQNGNLTPFKNVLIEAKNVKNVEIIEKCDSCDQHFERIVIDLSLQSVRLSFSDYSEISNFLKQEIRAKTGLECFVCVGHYQTFGYHNWIYKNKKYIVLKIASLLFLINQVHTRFTDVLNSAKTLFHIEIISKSESIDLLFEERIIELAKDIINNPGFKSSFSISDFMKDEIINRYGKIYGTNWLVTVGYGQYYDLSYSVKHSKRKFIDFLINELRFTIFQTL